MSHRYIVAGNKPWNREVFDSIISRYDGDWTFVSDPSGLASALAQVSRPSFIFFMHWSWKVPDTITSKHRCVCFHMTDVPYGRGGSPLQNLILRGHDWTKLTALRMTSDMDAGPVYAKQDFYIGKGSAQEVYTRGSQLSAGLMRDIVSRKAVRAKAQKGEVVVFERRNPEQSEIPSLRSVAEFYDYVRMLDAETYPKAFVRYRGFRLVLDDADFIDGKLVCKVTVVKEDGGIALDK